MERSEREGSTFAYPIKCMNCGLHYTVYSWVETWADTVATKGGFCPECGIGGNKLIHGPEERKEFIFELVPGAVPLTHITEVVRESPFGVMAPKLKDD